MKRLVASLAALILVSCGSSVASNLASPSPAAADVCRLPIGFGDKSGLLGYPSGKIESDPSSAVNVPFDAGGNQGVSYDWSLSRWLPVSFGAVAPDGRRYAAIGSNVLHLIDVASGADSKFSLPTDITADAWGVRWTLLNFDGSTVWLRGADSILAAYDVAQAKLTRITNGGGYWDWVEGGAAWGSNRSAGTKVISYDLKASTTRVWLDRPNEFVAGVSGFDQDGHPIATVLSNGTTHIVLLTAPSVATDIVSGPILGSAARPSPRGVLADSHGIWIGGDAVWLYRPGDARARLLYVSFPGGSPIEGPCR